MSSSKIHPAAYVDPKAELGANVTVGPNSYVGPDVVLGDNCVVGTNVTLAGHTTCGPDCRFHPGAVIGEPPQDLKYKGGPTRVEIGADNVFREIVTVHAGTEVAGHVTKIGSHNRFMVGVHIAHDAIVGDNCILSNYAQLAGHVCLEDKVTIAGIVGIHHFTTIGTMTYIGGLTRITSDVPPYMIVEGNPSRVRGFNETGMRRWGFSDDQVRGVRRAYRILYSTRAEAEGAPMLERLERLEREPDINGEVRYLCESVRRSLLKGVYGRSREGMRTDCDADRAAYYNSKNKTE